MFKDLICRTFRRPFKSATFKTKTKTKTLDVNPQNHSQASYTRLLKKEDGFVPLSILKKAINKDYNFKHPHQSLDYRSPFESYHY